MKSAPKYRNIKVVKDGHKFDSKRELARYEQLLQLRRLGIIKDLEKQVSFVLAPSVVIGGKKKRALRYVADFQYVDVNTGQRVVEDVKGFLTAVYKVKRHLMKSIHGIDIKEIR